MSQGQKKRTGYPCQGRCNGTSSGVTANDPDPQDLQPHLDELIRHHTIKHDYPLSPPASCSENQHRLALSLVMAIDENYEQKHVSATGKKPFRSHTKRQEHREPHRGSSASHTSSVAQDPAATQYLPKNIGRRTIRAWKAASSIHEHPCTLRIAFKNGRTQQILSAKTTFRILHSEKSDGKTG